MKQAHLKRCQVETPPEVVQLVWSLVQAARPSTVFDSVLDLGAGDGRFSRVKGLFHRYLGVEYDAKKVEEAQLALAEGAELIVADALEWEQGEVHDVCIGNPPYIRYHGLDRNWRDRALANLALAGGPHLKKTANAFVIFLTQAILRTADDGIVAQVVPFEWVTRPSASELREYIKRLSSHRCSSVARPKLAQKGGSAVRQ